MLPTACAFPFRASPGAHHPRPDDCAGALSGESSGCRISGNAPFRVGGLSSDGRARTGPAPPGADTLSFPRTARSREPQHPARGDDRAGCFRKATAEIFRSFLSAPLSPDTACAAETRPRTVHRRSGL